MSTQTDVMERIVALCRRRGFIFGSSEIYGGIGGFWDYGPLGCELKKNIKDAWWNDCVRNPPPGPNGREYQMVGVDCAIIMNPKVWEASGHVGGFSDPMVDCKTEGCKGRFRADQLDENPCPLKPSMTVGRYEKCQLTEPRAFNLMFETHVGALKDSTSLAYLRPETAQGIFVNFKNVLDSTRVKLPFGIAQIGKSFRNEINPRNYTFRSREFEQMEIEFFCHPSEAPMWYEYWRDVRHRWYVALGLKSDKLRLRDHDPDELAHYADACADVEYAFPFGVSELEGIANRTDFDLKAHQQHSGKDLTYYDDQRRERFIPYVIEPSAGVDRFALAVICEAYTRDENRASPEFMKFHPRLAPIKAAVFPLVAKDGLPDLAEPIFRELKRHYPCQYDVKQSIGKRYARMDEAGTPFCFTIDGQTKEDGTVTVRNRDDASQIRIDKSRCLDYLRDHLGC
ncbi:MAG: glycine--tRNA ligase [Planctomycetota bacterium]|nr:MAG: glycine--tRNA ligase [Planctomycetota bacterium]